MKFIENHIKILVWILRLCVGSVFIFSGISKAIDPWGFMYKLQDYLVAWGILWVPRASVLITGVTLSLIEFTAGVQMVLGCWRRVAAHIIFYMMCFMLPLTLYIAIFSPVDDCGCFGEALKISNWATFGKNVVLFSFSVLLVKWNRRVMGIFPPLAQWLVLIFTVLYCMMLSAIGYLYQPMVDFRQYPVGSSISEDIGGSDMKMIYEKDGVQKTFSVYDLPGDDWSYIGRAESGESANRLAVFDDGDEVTSDVFDNEGPLMLLVVTDPEYHTRARSSMANKINEYIESKGGSMVGLVPLVGERLEHWKDLATLDFDIYSVDDTQLKELARGEAALVYIEDGVIVWKRNIYFLPSDLLEAEGGDPLHQVFIPDEGMPFWRLTLAYIGCLLIVLLISVPFLGKYFRTYSKL